MFLSHVIDYQPCIKVICTVHDKVHSGQQAFQLFRTNIHHMGLDHNPGINLLQPGFCSLCLWHPAAGISFSI
ncbi:hypothetical protein D3C76_1503410 [compost metagenome]